MFRMIWQWLWNQVGPVMYKEFIHMFNDATTLRIAVVLPLIQIVIFGFAINTDVRDIPTAVFNQDQRPNSVRLVDALQNTTYFKVKKYVYSKQALLTAIRRGEEPVGIVVPPHYSDDLTLKRQATFQILIDGSDATTANQALGVSSETGTVLSQEQDAANQIGSLPLVIRIKPAAFVLYNPDLKTTFLTIPGLLGIVLLNVILFLTTFSLAKEREKGTLDQLLVTPLRPSGLMVGKIIPYVLLGFLDFNLVLAAMVFLFHVPIRGNIFLLEGLAVLFLASVLGLGLLVSTRTTSQMQAAQVSQLVVLPSILLSGFVFSIPAMPKVIQLISGIIPMTYFIQILRGIILRGAGFSDLLWPISMLALLGGLILMASIIAFRRKLG